MSLKIDNNLNISSQNLNQSSTFNNASCTIEDASKNLASAQRLTTDKNPTIQNIGQMVVDVARLIDSASRFIKEIGNTASAKKIIKILDRLIGLGPTMMPIASPTMIPITSPTSNTTQASILTSDRKLSPELKAQIKDNLGTYIECNVDTILFYKLKLQSSYSGQFIHNGEANKTFGKCC